MTFEEDFWGNRVNTYGEETKQLLYMREMGFPTGKTWRSSFTWNMGGRTVVDIGGGPSSVLLKCNDLGRAVVVDPAVYPEWVKSRYLAANILLVRAPR